VCVFVFVSVSVCVCCCAAPSYEHTLSHSNTDRVSSLNSEWRDKVCVCVCVVQNGALAVRGLIVVSIVSWGAKFVVLTLRF